MTTTVQHICGFLESFAPLKLAEDWDNVGLLVGDRTSSVENVMTCLTVTPDSVSEAIDRSADVIVTHHPMPFRPLKRLTTDSTVGKILVDLLRADIAVYSPHTAFDSAAAGINQQLAEGIGLTDIAPLIEPSEDFDPSSGTGRYGRLNKPAPLSDLVARTKELLSVDGLHIVGNSDTAVAKVAVACGSAGQFLGDAKRAGCDALLIGETNFHTCLEAEAAGVQLILPGHYASERFAVEQLAKVLGDEFSDLNVWASENEHDPLTWI